MDQIIRKHWTSLLGVGFILAAFVTLFKYTIDQGWITDYMKVGFGLLSGTGMCVAGLALARRNFRLLSAQIILGMGACILYATFSFAGIYYELWSPMTVLIGMTAVTAGASAFAYRFDSRLLMNIALAGGLLSPLLMQPATDQVFTLFLYLLVINTAFFYLSIAKGWSELRIHAFIGTWLVYGVYFVHFNPPTEGIWSLPFRYALAAFVFYLVGFLLSSWQSNRCFDGWNLYLSLSNGVLFGCWAVFILYGDMHYAYVLSFIGLVYAITGLIIRRLVGKIDVASASHALVGLLMLLLSATHVGSGMDVKPLINVYVWGGIAGVLAVVGQARRWVAMTVASLVIWFAVGCYWFVVTWYTPRGEWFGTFIPFLNWGSMAWVLLAVIGFYYSIEAAKSKESMMSHTLAILAHLIVGGLLTVQIMSVFEVYFNGSSGQLLQMTLSVSWGIYALLLFLWGAYRRQSLFRWFGTGVLILVAIKAIFLDLSGEAVLYKVVVLLILGGISFLITWVNGKWGEEKAEEQKEAAKEEQSI